MSIEVELTTEEKAALVKEYEEMVALRRPEIEAELKLAKQHLTNAENLCDKYGISMYSGISFLGQNYQPTGFDESKFGAVQDELADQGLLDLNEYGDGWEHSAVC